MTNTSLLKYNSLNGLAVEHPTSSVLNPIFTRPLRHTFHLVTPSPWPLVVAFSLWVVMLNLVSLFHYAQAWLSVNWELALGLFALILGVSCWWRDVIRESTYELAHTPIVRRGLLWGFALFIVSEVFLFFGFFWAFFHSSLAPSAAIGGMWPPLFLEVINPFQLPLVNTLTLISSGFTLTISHKLLKRVDNHNTVAKLYLSQNMSIWLFVTIGLGAFFLQCQAFEYYFAQFTYSDTIYGTTFYSLTGLHGMHVVVGTIFLLVCFIRSLFLHFTSSKQTGYKAAIWYWHFVDVVWIILFLVVYIWGGARRLA